MKEKINIAEILSIDDLPNEIWKDIPEYKGFYQVSNLGRVKSLKRFFKTGRGRIAETKLILQMVIKWLLYVLMENNLQEEFIVW